ncbi:uncharacterized protein BDW43DRAFT_48163 [Aspergillus alliaceus]|uniref:uncharacterized protein n=1 Tax=Petromyces alliaceus TaxID=209559 RepID=UPI0012A776B5|nr:uncharacterized protein BDW43DRAFT_48163 [Aspergillus alliaceus]KAB8234971.1 hypothetical protein BDW43DRAFT_48163 [Aspergillus alliaceus]
MEDPSDYLVPLMTKALSYGLRVSRVSDHSYYILTVKFAYFFLRLELICIYWSIRTHYKRLVTHYVYRDKSAICRALFFFPCRQD